MCGVVGVLNVGRAVYKMRTALHALQNRGRDGCGIVTLEVIGDEYRFHYRKFPGTVAKRFTKDVLDQMPGREGIGHTRYATAANSSGVENLQPLFFHVDGVPFSIAHNGNFNNHLELERTALKGSSFNTIGSDTERFLKLIMHEFNSDRTLPESIGRALSKMQGSCSAVLHTPGQLLAIRDSSGNRPLFWGRKGKGYVVASEPCALDALDVFDWEEVPPGTVMSFTAKRGVEVYPLPSSPLRFCVFELVYFGFPGSELYGVPVAEFRVALGRRMGELYPTKTDRIAGIPDSALEAADGYAASVRNSPPDRRMIYRRHDTGRTFILRGRKMRKKAVEEKFAFTTRMILGQSITVVDDSLVRGTTSEGISKALRKRGATEVHWRFPSPRIIESCFYGIATKDRSQLIAAHQSLEEIGKTIRADSVAFLELPEFKDVIAEHGIRPEDGCFACMDGVRWDL